MIERYALILKVVVVFSLFILWPAGSYAGPNNIYGVQKRSGSNNIIGVRRSSTNSGKAYGNSGSSIKNNYFGSRTNFSSGPKTKIKDSAAATWGSVYSEKRDASKPTKFNSPPEGMEAF